MKSNRQNRRTVQYVVCTAIAAALVSGCASSGGLAMGSSSKAANAQSESAGSEAVAKAERLVAKSPQDAALRAELGQAYLMAGRFESAITTFSDARHLGDESVRTALSLALAYGGAGQNDRAVSILDQWRDSIPASDLGLALALAGETGRGVTVLSEALRAGQDTPKLRQNLAYAYALDGRWREARLMAAQDVPGNELDARISEWATMGRPGDYRKRVAGTLGAPVRADTGQPASLALARPDTAPVEAVALSRTYTTEENGELPPVEDGESFWIAEAADRKSVV